ncbi:BTAD domain-containing putative transcriptional regulator [Desulfoluna sp.]|uniref:BTAD domain-containing putative transcriptional regulator n=1 Tax=Desulfoluna sp. TaxID=2045199 RepID=UPI002639F87B|nr:BTAD domain-containing putative transcriptional regulator [Desulfoluna sp.]
MSLSAKTGSSPEQTGKGHYIRHAVLQDITLYSYDKNRSILIEAQAGQGKTTLVRQYLSHVGTPGLWYALSPEDRDAVILIDRFYALLQKSIPRFSSRLIATMLAKGEVSYQSVGKYARILLSDLKKSLKEEVYLVFDDLHLIEDSPSALKFLESLLSDPGHGLYFILISRRRIPRQLRSLFQARPCVYLDNQSLAFSKKETREFVYHCMEIPLTRNQLNQLYETTHGWVMGLRSKCVSFKAKGNSALASDDLLHGDAERDFHYFAEEVYPFMASSASGLILKLALLDEIPLALARETGNTPDIAETLSYLSLNNFFLTQKECSGETYAFHHLFRDFLRVKCRQQCHGDEIASFLNRAGAWYEDKHQFKKALACFFKAANHDEIEALLERHGLDIYRKGHLYCVHQLLRQLPAPVAESRSCISFFLGLLSVEIDPALALHFLHRSRALFASQENPMGELLATTEICFNHIFIDGELKSGKALFSRATELFHRLRDRLSPFYLARTANALANCYFYFLGDTKNAEACAEMAKETARAHDMRSLLAEAYTASCFVHMGQGKFFRSAGEIDAQLIHLADPRVKDSTQLLARLTQLNQLEITGDFFNYNHMKPITYRIIGAALVQNTVFHGFTKIWETCQALANGDMDHALRLINEALTLDEAGQSAHLRSQFYHYQAYICGLKQDKDAALAAAEQSILLRQKAHVPYFVALQAMILGGMYAQLQMYEEAEASLEKAISVSEKINERFIRCGALAHRAFMNLQRGQTEPAVADTRDLLSFMEKERYLHFDSWTPRIMLPVLRFAHRQGLSPEFTRMLAAEKLHVAFEADDRTLPLLEITTLGQFALHLDGKVILKGTQLSHNEQRLLSAILCSSSQSIGIHEAFHMLWPDSLDDKAMKALNVMLFRLRKKVSHPDMNPAFDFQDYLQHKNKQLFLTHCRIDARTFQEATARGITQNRNHHYWQASNSFRRALSLWKGPFLKGFAYDDYADELNDRSLLNTLSQGATLWSDIIKAHGDYIPEDLDLIENSISRGAGTPEMMKNLFDIHAASGNTGKLQHLTQTYQDALLRSGYTQPEADEELEGLWAHEKPSTSPLSPN